MPDLSRTRLPYVIKRKNRSSTDAIDSLTGKRNRVLSNQSDTRIYGCNLPHIVNRIWL